jgi:soluble lytic murein transglycosylase-like protein
VDHAGAAVRLDAGGGKRTIIKFQSRAADQVFMVCGWILLAWSAMAQTPQPPPTPPRATGPTAGDLMRAAIEKQRAAVRKQAASVGAWLAPWSAAIAAAAEVAEAPCEPIAEAAVTPIIDATAKAQDVQAKLLRAMIEQESGLRPCAISAKGAQGLMQLMPDTAQQLAVLDVFDPKENIEAGAKYLKQLIDKYKGDLKLALGAYNAGPTTVDQAGGIPDIQETKDYVEAILKRLAK